MGDKYQSLDDYKLACGLIIRNQADSTSEDIGMLVGTSVRRVAIVGGVRIPFARGNGAYAEVGTQDMLTAVLRSIVERYGLHGQRLDEVAAGAVIKHSSQWNLTREAVLGSGLAAETPGLDLQRACGTGLEAAIVLGNKIALGQIDSAIAAGVDSVSDPPVAFPRSFQQLLLHGMRGKTRYQRIKPWLSLRAKHLRPVLPGFAEPRTGLSMGESAELMVRTWGVVRAEQDQLAFESHQKAANAYAQGFYTDLVQPYRTRQQYPQRYQPRKTREAAADIRLSGARHVDRRKFDSNDGWCGRCIAVFRGLGERTRFAGARLSELR
jgi:acetyl-CoA acetyltransferase